MNPNELHEEFENYASMIRNQDIEAINIPQAVNSVSRTLTIADRLRELAKKANNLDMIEVITELRYELANSKNGLVDAVEEIAKLKQENAELKEQINTSSSNDLYAPLKDQMTRDHNGLYHYPGVGEAFCPDCIHNDLKSAVTCVPTNRFTCKYECRKCDWFIETHTRSIT